MLHILTGSQLFAGTDAPDSWFRHARGIGILIEQRGPEAHAEGWDAAMLLSFRGILVTITGNNGLKPDLDPGPNNNYSLWPIYSSLEVSSASWRGMNGEMFRETVAGA